MGFRILRDALRLRRIITMGFGLTRHHEVGMMTQLEVVQHDKLPVCTKLPKLAIANASLINVGYNCSGVWL